MPYDDDDFIQGPTEAEIEAFIEKELALELALAQAWARDRLQVGTLDSDIKKLIVRKIGTLNKEQVQFLQMQRTLIPFGVTPTVFVKLRSDEMFLTREERAGLGSPDLSDKAETEMYKWALTNICEWLENQPDGKQRYQLLLARYQEALQKATDRYEQTNGHPPIVVKTINVVMTIARAKKFIRGDFA
jgi:hypothetical protein